MDEDHKTRPLFSPTAEEELYLLATNFLLHVALIIVAILVAKVYFPESLDRDGSKTTSSTAAAAADDEAEEEVTSLLELEERAGDNEDLKANEYKRNNEYLEQNDELSIPSKQQQHNFFKSKQSFSLEFDQLKTPKHVVIRRLAFCAFMLNFTFIIWGMLQERMLTRRYPRITGEYFTYSYMLVFTNRLWSCILSGALVFYVGPTRSKSVLLYEYSFPSVSNLLSSWCQYEALRYVSFPTTTLFKSFKLAPVMLMGIFINKKKYPTYDYLVALIIGTGISMFMKSTENLNFGYDAYGEEEEHTLTGIMLLILYLAFDSFTGQWQSRMFTRHKDLSLLELLFATSLCSTVLSFITLVHTGELYPAVDFIIRHQEIHLHFFLFSICSTIGQLLIFYTIKNFGAVVFALIMAVRVLFSIGISCVLYGHTVNFTGFMGILLVTGAVLYRTRRKAAENDGDLIRWEGYFDKDQAAQVVQELHEHLDM